MKIPFIHRLATRITELYVVAGESTSRVLRSFTSRVRGLSRTPTYSWGRPDYEYWRRAYNCQVAGLELSGVFIRPIVNKIAAWTLGRPPDFRFKRVTNQKALSEWWDLHHSEVLNAFRSSLKQGDGMMVINSDLSVTILPPETVEPIVAEDDYGKVIGWRVRQVFPHPTDTWDKMIVIDEYYADRRVHTVETYTEQRRTVYPNLIGVVPLVHIPNQLNDGEYFGHPEVEAIQELLHRYGHILEAAVEGNILQGRPTPVLSFETVQDLNAFWTRYGKKESHTLANGTTEDVETLTVDLSELLTVSGAEFAYKSPAPFGEDVERLLGLLFYLILEHTELPEFVFGNAIGSSKASAETQMPIFEIFIRMRQRDCLRWMLNISKVVLGYMALMRPGVTVEEPVLQWPKLTQNGRLTLDSVSWAFGEGLLDERTALLLLPLDVEKPDEILKKARKEAEERREKAAESEQKWRVVAGRNGGSNTEDLEDSLRREIAGIDTYRRLENGNA